MIFKKRLAYCYRRFKKESNTLLLVANDIQGKVRNYCIKVNNESVGDTVRNNIEAECANHSLIRSGSLCGSNYSHVAIVNFMRKPRWCIEAID